MRITILGCGASGGVPLIGCRCAVCASPDPKNMRQRVSILVEEGATKILVDASPDLRQQALRHNITAVDAVIFTHDHSDHSHGIDELRAFNYHNKAPLDVYADRETLASLQSRFAYAFKPPIPEYGWFRPCLALHEIVPHKQFVVGAVDALPFDQMHGGYSTTLGLRFGKFAYSTDVKELPESAFTALQGVEVWVVDCLKYTPAPTHAHLPLTLEWIARLKPKLAILTHMSHEFDYEKLRAELPQGVVPAHDGMVVEV